MRIVSLVAAVILLSGCINTSVKSHLDADFKDLRLRKVVLDMNQIPPTMRADMENSLSSRLKEAGVVVMTMSQIVPPTRDYSAEQVKELVVAGGNDAILAIQITDANQNIMLTGSYNYMSGSAYTSGNRTNFNASGFSAPVGRAESSTTYKATLYDPMSGRRMWVGDVLTKAQGTAFVGRNDKIADSAAEGVVNQLRTDGRLK